MAKKPVAKKTAAKKPVAAPANPVTLYRLIFSIIAAFTFIYVWDFVVHAVWLMPTYLATQGIWNDESQMTGRYQWYVIHQLTIAIVYTVFYHCWRRKSVIGAIGSCHCPYRNAMGFGGFLGLLTGVSMAGFYVYLAIPASLAVSWLVAELFKGIVLGMVLAWLYPTAKVKA